MNFTKDELAAWLKSHNRSREWLAEATGKSLGTIHNWFSNRSIPEDARTTIALLMERDLQATPESSGVDETGLITFTTAEFERIERARLAVGNPPRPEFYRNAIIQYLDDQEELDEIQEAKERDDDDLALLADEAPAADLPARKPVTYPTGQGKGGRKK
jgi:hypothetical protein